MFFFVPLPPSPLPPPPSPWISQVSSPVDDPLAKILEELPVPGNEMMESKHVTLTLDLIQRTRDNLGEKYVLTFLSSKIYPL